MSRPVFPDKSQQPSSTDLYSVLGSAALMLQEIEEYLSAGGYNPDHEWKFYSKKAGWTVAIKAKERTVFHLLPNEDSFTVVFTFGKRAVTACEGLGLPENISQLIANARVYAEGRSFRFEVSTSSDVESAIKTGLGETGQLVPVQPNDRMPLTNRSKTFIQLAGYTGCDSA